MKRAFLLVECDDGWAVVPASLPKETESFTYNEVEVRWKRMSAYSRFSDAVWHLEERLGIRALPLQPEPGDAS